MQTFWRGLQNWWNNMENTNITIDGEAAIVGITRGEEEKVDKLNACLQLARWYIYVEKLNLQQPFLYRFLCQLKYKLKIEKNICIKNNQIKKYETIWENIEQHLD